MKNALINFEKTVAGEIREVWNISNRDTRFDRLSEGAKKIAKAAQHTGDFYFFGITEDEALKEEPIPVENYIGTFLFPERVKSFLILWRDILFQQQKAELLNLEGEVSENDLENLNKASKETVLSAASSLESFFDKEIKRLKEQKGGIEKAIENWKPQANPWKNYSEQIEFLSEQCSDLRVGQSTLKKAVFGFENIQKIKTETASECLKDIDRWIKKAESVADFITTLCEGENPLPGEISKYVEEVSEEIAMSDRLTILNRSVEQYLSEMPKKMQVPINTSVGMIRYRDIDFQKIAKQWLESETTPLMYEAWELTETAGNSLKMALINILNRSVLLNNRMKDNQSFEMDGHNLVQPISLFLKKAATFKQNLEGIEAILVKRLEQNLKLSGIYNEQEDFLPIPLESTMRQYRLDRSKILSKFQVWWNDNLKFIQNWKRKVEQEDALSTSEKVVRFVRSRTGEEDNNMYRNIFRTTGYIGESFWVGRKQELARIEEIIGNWKLGYRGSVVLFGDRFSGKSLFGEVVANRYFSLKTIHLHPESVIKIAGRTFETSHDLGAALDFIKKYASGNQVLVWLDNIELWQNQRNPLNRNVRMLKKAMGGGSSDIFYLVAMTGWMKNHLAHFHNMESMFQAEINLNRMSLREVREAILIRHGATHKTLINEKSGEEVSGQRFYRLTGQVYSASSGNIGDTLTRWSGAVRKVDEEQVVFKQKESFPFPDFINSENGLLLSAIVLAKRINEYDLRKIFGPAFNDKYSSTLQQLINIGLLERLPDGKLRIREAAANEVGRLLEKKKFL